MSFRRDDADILKPPGPPTRPAHPACVDGSPDAFAGELSNPVTGINGLAPIAARAMALGCSLGSSTASARPGVVGGEKLEVPRTLPGMIAEEGQTCKHYLQ